MSIKFLILALACATNAGSNPPTTQVSRSIPMLEVPTSVPVFGANATFKQTIPNRVVEIEDFFTNDNGAPGSVVHVKRPGVILMGDFPYDRIRGEPWLNMIMVIRDVDGCRMEITFDPTTSRVISRNPCPVKFTDQEVEIAREELEAALEEVHTVPFIKKIERPEPEDYTF